MRSCTWTKLAEQLRTGSTTRRIALPCPFINAFCTLFSYLNISYMQSPTVIIFIKLMCTYFSFGNFVLLFLARAIKEIEGVSSNYYMS